MSRESAAVRTNVHALVGDLLPVLVPDARLRDDPSAVALRLGDVGATVSTSELVEYCSSLPQHRWPRAVEDWLRQVGSEARLAITESRAAGDLRERLRVVLRHRDQLEDVGEALGLVTVPYGRYFVVVPALTDGPLVHPLTRLRASLLELRGVGERALRNTIDLELPRLAVRAQQLTLREHATVVTLPDSPYVSAGLLDIRRFLPDPCPYGALVGVPRTSMLILHPVRSTAALRFIPDFAEIVHEMHDRAADACSHRTYWWTDDTLLELEVRPGDGPPETRVVVPAELTDLARRLPPG